MKNLRLFSSKQILTIITTIVSVHDMLKEVLQVKTLGQWIVSNAHKNGHFSGKGQYMENTMPIL